MNWKSSALLVALVGLLAGITACRGYTVEDYIKAQTTQDIQETVGVGPTVPLSQAPLVREQYVSNFVSNLKQYDANVADAQLFSDFVGSVVETGGSVAEGPIKSLPFGEALFAGLGGLAMLFVNKPGTAKRIEQVRQDEHRKTWDEAVKETTALLSAK